MATDWSRPFSLDPDKPRWPQILSTIGQSAIIFGGPVLGVISINRYPILVQNNTIYIVGLTSIICWFLLSFLFFGVDDFPPGTPKIARLLVHAGWGLCVTFLLLGIGGIVNGYGTPSVTRDAAVVSKHPTLHRDPSRRIYYVAIRAWPDSRMVVELHSPKEVYDSLDVPLTAIDTPQRELEAMPDIGHVRLTLGKGRFGLEWLKQIDLAE